MPERNNEDKNYHQDKAPFPAYKGDKNYIFVSYAHSDAEKIYPDLIKFRKEGFNIWYDEGIDEGTYWPEEIEKALLNCSVFVVFISETSIKSENVRNEIDLALDEHKKVIPIYLEEAELKYGLKLRMSNKQGILRHSLSIEKYDERWFKAFKKELKEPYMNQYIPEPEPPQSDEENVEEEHSEEPEVTEIPLKNFKHLEELLLSDKKNIILEYDIKLDKTEEDAFKEGLIIKENNIIIDGNNHYIDANNLSRIFKITGKNIQIKNLIFKNGYSSNPSDKKHENGGGAIFVDDNASLTLIKCEFNENYSESDGGALFNRGEIKNIRDCYFEKNTSKTSGGAIANFEYVHISKTQLINNQSLNGAAIYNYENSTLKLFNSQISENKSSMAGGGVYNYGELIVSESCKFSDNNTKLGGAIFNYGFGRISNTSFRNNSSIHGGAVFNINKDKIKFYGFNSSTFENKDGSLKFNECNFVYNNASEYGGVITNLSYCKLENCIIGKNHAESLSHIFYNGPEGILNNAENITVYPDKYLSTFTISNCEFLIKSVENRAIYNQKNCLIKIMDDTLFDGQQPDEDSIIFDGKGDIIIY